MCRSRSLERLRRAVQPERSWLASVFALQADTLYGAVTIPDVALAHASSLGGGESQIVAQFRGRFVTSDGRVTLIGAYSFRGLASRGDGEFAHMRNAIQRALNRP
jgi:hypothetical protein